MKRTFILGIFILLSTIAKSQNEGDTSTYLAFKCVLKVEVYFDSAYKYDISSQWKKADFRIVIDPYGNRIKMYEDGNLKIITMGKKTDRYNDLNDSAVFHNWGNCTDNEGRRLSVRVKFPLDKDFTTTPTYLYYDYPHVTYAFQLRYIIKNKP